MNRNSFRNSKYYIAIKSKKTTIVKIKKGSTHPRRDRLHKYDKEQA